MHTSAGKAFLKPVRLIDHIPLASCPKPEGSFIRTSGHLTEVSSNNTIIGRREEQKEKWRPHEQEHHYGKRQRTQRQLSTKLWLCYWKSTELKERRDNYSGKQRSSENVFQVLNYSQSYRTVTSLFDLAQLFWEHPSFITIWNIFHVYIFLVYNSVKMH